MKKFFYSFYFKTQKCPFWGVNQFSSSLFQLLKQQTHKCYFDQYFLKLTKKSIINCQIRPKWHFWQSITFFCVFSKIPTKRTFVHLLFLKLNQSQNTKKTFFGGVFFKNQKRTFSGVQNGTFKKSNFKFVFLRLFFIVNGSFVPIFIKKY